MKYAEFIELAKANYTKGGDSYYECWDERTFNEYEELFGKITKKSALQMFKDNAEIEAEYEAAAEWYGGMDQETIDALNKENEEYEAKKAQEEKEMANNAQVQIIEIEVEGVRYTQTRPGYYYKRVDDKNVRIGKAEWEAAFDAYTNQVNKADEDWDLENEVKARKDAEEKKDRETEENFNGKKAEPEVDHYTVHTFYAGMTGYVVEKNGVEVYNGFSPDEIIERFGFNPNEVTEIDIPRKKETKKVSKPRRSKDVAFEMDTIEGHITLTAKQVDFIKHLPDTNFWENGLDSCPWCDILADEIGGQFAGKPMTVGAMISTLREKKLVSVGRDLDRKGKPKFMTLTAVGRAIAEKLGLH